MGGRARSSADRVVILIGREFESLRGHFFANTEHTPRGDQKDEKSMPPAVIIFGFPGEMVM
jgi:hypothetical protein